MSNNILFNSIFKNLIGVGGVSGGGDGGGSKNILGEYLPTTHLNDPSGMVNHVSIQGSQIKNSPNERIPAGDTKGRLAGGGGNDPEESYMRIFFAKTTGIDSRL